MHSIQLSIIIPLLNEAATLESTVAEVFRVISAQLPVEAWELILVNDGSTDETSLLAHRLASSNHSISVIDHPVNLGLGAALKTGFTQARGKYFGVLDADLSYEPDCLLTMFHLIQTQPLAMVVASPYHPDGKTSGVPLSRWILSRGANLYLSWAIGRQIRTLTGMVRVYRASFLDSLSLHANRNDINLETISHALEHGERIGEVPAHLTWRRNLGHKVNRRYPIKHWIHHISSVLSQGIHLRAVRKTCLPVRSQGS